MVSGSSMVTAHIHASVPHRAVQKKKLKNAKVEKQSVAAKTANATETVKKKSPKTADDNRMLTWMLLFAAGASAAGVTVYGRKRKTDRS